MKLALIPKPATELPFHEIWKAGISAILMKMEIEYGFGTAEGDTPAGEIDGGWYIDIELAPAGVGSLLMVVMDENPPYVVSYEITPGPVSDGADYPALMMLVGRTFADKFGTGYVLSETG